MQYLYNLDLQYVILVVANIIRHFYCIYSSSKTSVPYTTGFWANIEYNMQSKTADFAPVPPTGELGVRL